MRNRKPIRSKTIDAAEESREPQTLSHKKYVYGIILLLSITGLLVPFAAQFVLPFFFPKQNVAGAEIWNQYVSIILGIVATLMSIVSLKMSFDNVNQSHQTELKTRDLFHNIEKHLKDIEHNQGNYLTKSDIVSLGILTNKYVIESEHSINTQWIPPSESKNQESKNI